MNNESQSTHSTPPKSSDRPRIKTSTRPPAREAMPWYTCAYMVF